MKAAKATKTLKLRFYDNEPEHNKKVFKVLLRTVVKDMNKKCEVFTPAGLK